METKTRSLENPIGVAAPRLLIETAWSEAVRVDRENRVIHDVKILGRESKNGRVYTEKAMAEAAALYEGCDVNIDHPPIGEAASARRLADGFGLLREVRQTADAVFGDLHYFDRHPLSPLVLERAERMPDKFGLSHNAAGRVSQRDGLVVVESIERVLSVDLVRHPATTSGLFEELLDHRTDGASMALREELDLLRQRVAQLEKTILVRRLLERLSIDPARIDEARFGELLNSDNEAAMRESIAAWPRSIVEPHRRPSINALYDASEAAIVPREPAQLARAIA